MRFALSVALVSLPLTALAEDGGDPGTPQVATQTDQAIIGGAEATPGKWPDAAALRWGGYQECSGTLIAPTVVLTAGHCVIDVDGPPDSVLINSVTKVAAAGSETIGVMTAHEYPRSQATIDAAIVILKRPATTPPRAIANGWARFEIKNGAPVALVGYGTIDMLAMMDSQVLREATTTITDAGCTTSAGCTFYGRPDGELGAGGMGVDTCPGDSGGPLYLTTEFGNFVAGITARGYDDNVYDCSEGGIYGRPDKIVDWIEETSGVKVTHGPEPTAEPFGEVVRGNPAETKIIHNDPKSDSHKYEIAQQPGYAKAAVSSDGTVRICPQKDIVGGDTVVVRVTDTNDETRSLEVKLGFDIVDGDPADSCDEKAFGNMDTGGGCCDTRRDPGGSIPLFLFVAAVLLRRRRAR